MASSPTDPSPRPLPSPPQLLSASTSPLTRNSAPSTSSPPSPPSRRVEREIEVSQWGNVAIEEVVHARNSATPLTGEFSRLDYFRSDPDASSAWGGFWMGVSRRLAERARGQACEGPVLPRHHRQRDHEQRAAGEGGGGGGAVHAIPDDGRLEDRVLLGVAMGRDCDVGITCRRVGC